MAPGANPPEGEIAFETLDQGQQSDIEEEQTRTVRTQGELEALYQEHAPDEDPPDVDLDEHLVLAIFKGQSPDACHGAQITNITGVDDDTLHVTGEFVEVTGTACAEVVTYPYHIVTIDRYDANITYQIDHTQRDASQGQDDQRADDDQDNADPDESDQETPPEGPIAFETLEEGQQSNIEDERTQTVQDQNEWETLYDEHNPDEEPPMVDFNETVVLAAFKGESPDGCHGAEITNVTGTDEGTIRADVEFFEVTDAFCTEALTYPFHIVTIDRYDAEVTYEIEHTQREG